MLSGFPLSVPLVVLGILLGVGCAAAPSPVASPTSEPAEVPEPAPAEPEETPPSEPEPEPPSKPPPAPVLALEGKLSKTENGGAVGNVELDARDLDRLIGPDWKDWAPGRKVEVWGHPVLAECDPHAECSRPGSVTSMQEVTDIQIEDDATYLKRCLGECASQESLCRTDTAVPRACSAIRAPCQRSCREGARR